ncbi:uncharacterized protein [Branchiostoma lanceolatum]|uniref:uncharacterized protein n=1 Tax=Branchiostoma lanceolatum TaxID=7740 RepID=UPI003452B7D8
MMTEISRQPRPSAAGERTAANWHDHMVTSLKPDMADCPPVKLVWCGDISGEVGVMGSWDDWSKVWKLNRSGNGEYSVALRIPCGQHEYKFRVNDNWFHDATKPTVSNSFGTLNNIVNVVKASNGPTKPGINGAPKTSIADKIPNGTNGPLQASDSPKTAKEVYELKTNTTNGTAPKCQEIRKPEPVNLGDVGSGQQPPQKTASYRVPPTVLPKPAKVTVATAQAAYPHLMNKEVSDAKPMKQTCPMSQTMAADKDVSGVWQMQQQQTHPMSKTTAYRVPPPTVPPKAPTEAAPTAQHTARARPEATTAAPHHVRARPEIPQKRAAGKPGTAGVERHRKPEAAPPMARTTFEQPPMTKPKPTQKRVVPAQATSRTAAKTADGKGPSSQPGQAETRHKFAGRKF